MGTCVSTRSSSSSAFASITPKPSSTPSAATVTAANANADSQSSQPLKAKESVVPKVDVIVKEEAAPPKTTAATQPPPSSSSSKGEDGVGAEAREEAKLSSSEEKSESDKNDDDGVVCTDAADDLEKEKSSPSSSFDEDYDKKLASVLQHVRIIAEGIDSQSDATAHEMAKIKDSLLRIAKNRTVSPKEISKAEAICNFMILDSMEECLTLWFGKSKETDDRIWSDFAEDVTAASAGMYEHWSHAVEHPRMIVALVILLDQFRRNMFRGTRGMYKCDAMCAGYVKRAMAAGIADKLKPKEMIFLLLNLTHSEDVEDQHLCMREYLKLEKTLDADDPLRVFHDIFNRHVDVVEKFCRFPHRNEIYGRMSTPKEEEFLADGSFRFDLPVRKSAKGGFTFYRDGRVLWGTAKKLYKETTGPKLLKVVEEVQKSYMELYDSGKDDPADDGDMGPSASKFFYDDPDAHAMAIETQKFLRIGDDAPNFTAKSTHGILNFHEYLGKSWGVLFSHPKDFTPVCTTELGRAAQLQEEFDKRDVKLCAVSVDLLRDHAEWKKDIEKISGATLDYPLIEDRHRKISMQYGMLDQTSLDLKNALSITIRSVFIINPKKKVALILTYPVPVGRNFSEILRAVDALKTNWDHGVATPADWKRKDPTVVLPFYTDDEAVAKFKTIDKKTSYLRFTPDPGAPPPAT